MRILDDPVKRAEFFALLSVGVSQRDACAQMGFSEQTVRNMRKRDRTFADEMERKVVAAKVLAITCVTQAAKKNAQIALAFLGRKYPNEWAHRKPDAIEPQKIAALINQLVAHIVSVVPEEFHPAISQGVAAFSTGVLSQQNAEGDSDAT